MTAAIDTILADAAEAAGADRPFSLPDGWLQGRTVYGGVVAALLLQHGRCLAADSARRPRHLSMSFVAPTAAGATLLRGRVLRTGGSSTFVEVALEQGEQTCASALAVFGAERDSALAIPAPAPVEMQPAEGLIDMPLLPGVPECVQHMQLRWAAGSPPFSGGGGGSLGGWCRFRAGAHPDREEHAVALMDAWPAPILGAARAPVAASSMTWSIDFARRFSGERADGFWGYHARSEHVAGGYSYSSAWLHHPAGELALVGRQAVAVFG